MGDKASFFESLFKNFKVKHKELDIDNHCFRLHYRATTLLLFASSLLVASQQYVGDHIACISHEKAIPVKVMNTFCFFTATFTIPKFLNSSALELGILPHPGIGPHVVGDPGIIRHNYYQWVPFVLFGQALAFYLPHYIWKKQEGGRLDKLTIGLKYMAYSLTDSGTLKAADGTMVPPKSARDSAIGVLRKAFFDRLHVHSSWALWLVSCEVLNVANLVLQVYLTQLFLGGKFLTLGPKAISTKAQAVDELDSVFPKVTKCTFHKYGPSGTLQAHDALCVMSLNIINEKIFAFLWFWYLILAVLTLLGMFWRLATVLLHSRSEKFNRYAFSWQCNGKYNPWSSRLMVTKEFHFSDWLFLYYICKNINASLYEKLFKSLGESLSNVGWKEPKFKEPEPLLLNFEDEFKPSYHKID